MPYAHLALDEPPVAEATQTAPVRPRFVPVLAAPARLEPGGGDVDHLLARVARGDGNAFERLHAATRTPLLALALGILANRAHAEEVVQEAYVTIWQSAARRRLAGGSGMGWMRTIVRNRAIDRRRRIARDPCVGGTDAMIDGFAAATEDREESTLAIAPLLARLSADQRAALRAAYFQGLSHREVAEQFGVPLGTAKSWIRRGLAELRRMIERSQR